MGDWQVEFLASCLDVVDDVTIAERGAFVRRGRTVVAFHSAAPIFAAAARRDVIATALARVDERVG